MKKCMALLLAFCVLLALCACGEKPAAPAPAPESESVSSSQPAVVPPVSEPAPAESVQPEPVKEETKSYLPLVQPGEDNKIRFGIAINSNCTSYDDNKLTQWIEEQTGVEIEFVQYSGSAADVATQISLAIAANEKLPDILYSMDGVTFAASNEYGESGFFADLKDYFEDPDLSHFYHQAYEEQFGDEADAMIQRMLAYATDKSSGSIYCFPTVNTNMNDNMVVQMMINKDWLEKLNLKAPHTVQELHDVLVAFRDGDPNGNGLKDEIPMLGRPGNYRGDIIQGLINAFVYCNDLNRYNVTDGKVWVPQDTDEYRQALIFIKSLVDEGLLSPLSWTITKNKLTNLLNPKNGVYTIGVSGGHPTLVFPEGNDGLYHYVPLAPFADETGKGGYGPMNVFGSGRNSHVTCDAANPELAFRLLCFMVTRECDTRARYGEFGVDWVYAEPGALDAYGNQAFFTLLNANIYADANNKCWHTRSAIINERATTESYNDTSEYSKTRAEYIKTQFAQYDAAGQVPEVYELINYTDEETEKRNDISGDLHSFFSKSRSDFCNGISDPANDADWKQYLDSLNRLRLPEYVSIAQTAYTRSVS